MSVYGKMVINISPEQINEISEYFINKSYFIIESESSKIEEFQKGLEKFFKNTGIKYTTIIEIITKAANDITEVIRVNGINKTSISNIVTIIETTIKQTTMNFSINDINSLKFKNYDANKIKNSFILLANVLIINTLFINVLMLLFGPTVGFYIGAVIIAPLFEEFAKKIAIKGDFSAEFTVVFNSSEFIQYVFSYKELVGLTKIIKTRSMVVLMHVATTIIQYLSNNKKIQKLLKLDKEEDKDKLSMIGYITGVLLHSAWNSGAGNIIIKSMNI